MPHLVQDDGRLRFIEELFIVLPLSTSRELSFVTLRTRLDKREIKRWMIRAVFLNRTSFRSSNARA